MEDQPEAEVPTLGCGDHGVEIVLDADRVLLDGEAEAPRHATDVGVDGQARQAERHAPHDVGGLAPNPWEAGQVAHRGGNLAPILVGDPLGCTEDRPGLRREEAGRVDHLGHHVGIGSAQGLGVGPSAEKVRGDQVDPGVGALRREDRGDQQLEGVAVIQFADGVGVLLGQAAVRLPGTSSGRARAPATGGRGLRSRHQPTVASPTVPADLVATIDAALGIPHEVHLGQPRWWLRPPTPTQDSVIAELGLVALRRIDRLERPLPLDPPGTAATTRPFDPARDADEWLRVNNAAFAWHPDQGGWDARRLATALDEPWVDLDGFLVHDAPSGGLDGFCWTKVHPGTPLVGEIFVIAVDPAAHGGGLGRGLVVAGLDHLARKAGAQVGMLYVEHDNAPAQHLYAALGFELAWTDVAVGLPDDRPR